MNESHRSCLREPFPRAVPFGSCIGLLFITTRFIVHYIHCFSRSTTQRPCFVHLASIHFISFSFLSLSQFIKFHIAVSLICFNRRLNSLIVHTTFTCLLSIKFHLFQADASLCLCVQFLIGGLYCYNIVNEIHEITPFNQIRLNWSVSLN